MAKPLDIVWAPAAVASAVAIGHLLAALTPIPSLSMVFLLAVLFSAVAFGMWPAIYASFLSFLAYNFLFIEPLYTFTIAEPFEFLALVIFLIVAIITSALAGRVRDHARVAAERMQAMQRLYEFTRKISRIATFDAIGEAAAAEMQASLGRPAVIFLNDGGNLTLASSSPAGAAIDAAAISAAQWASAPNEPAGLATSIRSAV